MRRLLSVNETQELLDGLSSAVAEFTAREEQRRQSLSAELTRIQRRIQQSTQAQVEPLSAEIAGSESSCAVAQERSAARFEERKTAIDRGYKTCKPRRLRVVDEREKQQKSDIQLEFAESKRRQGEGLHQANATLELFNSQLAAERGALERQQNEARKAFGGYGTSAQLPAHPPEPTGPDLSQDANQLLDRLHRLLEQNQTRLKRFRTAPLLLLFRWLPLWLLVLLIFVVNAALIPTLRYFGINSFSIPRAAIAVVVCMVGSLILYFLGRSMATPAAVALAASLEEALRLHDACAETAGRRHRQEQERIKQEADGRTRQIQVRWKEADQGAAQARLTEDRRSDEQVMRLTAQNEALRRSQLNRLERTQADRIARLKKQVETLRSAAETERVSHETRDQASHQAGLDNDARKWQARIQPLCDKLNASREAAQTFFPEWRADIWEKWTPPANFAHAAQFARLEVDVEQWAGAAPLHERLALPFSLPFDLPLLLTFPDQGSLLFETKNAASNQAADALNNIILRLLSVAPPGRVNFSIIDPVELGQNFAGVMHLADFEERLINSRIWTQAGQIEQQLANLNEHIEKVTQMYLRNEYATIAEYNEQAGRIAEKYHFLVVADFPVNFSDTAARRLMSIVASGPRCGVYTLIHWDRRRSAPADFVPDELRKNCVCLERSGDGLVLAAGTLAGLKLRLEAPPDPDLATAFLQRVGHASIDSNRVEMPFGEVAPPESERWSQETTQELRVPIGRTGATKLQYLALGKDTRQHALIAGKTGSGKSTLFHVIVTNLALWCSPEQVEFYLVDFKKGVEFKCYATSRLPHARVVAIESDREFGLSVLQRVDEELKRRGDLFRKLGVQDVAGYKKAGGQAPIPRTLLIIDEFQEFFVEDDRIAQNAALLLDRIVRQGRAFGIHVILGSQTLGGAYTLARATLGQMVVRIALQCNEADAYLIMDEDNPAPRLLSRPGEAIYNDSAGALAGNCPFQIVWLPEEERATQLARVRQLAEQAATPYAAPIVFEGNAPADVKENTLLRAALEAQSLQPVTTFRAWFGAPNSIKGPTEAVFRRQSGNNLLIVGQRDEAALAILGVSLISLAAQHARSTAKFLVFDCLPEESPEHQFLEQVVRAIPHEVSLARTGEIDSLLSGLVAEVEGQSDAGHGTGSPATYLFIHGLPRFKKLRHEEDFGISLGDGQTTVQAGVLLNRLICEGPSVGLHVICTCDTVNNMNRFLSRKAVSEFEMRVLFQMSANDSAALIDSPKAGELGLHRAIFYNEQEGYLETFRPYALPEKEWIEEAGKQLARVAGRS